MTLSERQLPSSTNAECAVLGSILIDPDAITRVDDFLLPADFYGNAHRAIFDAMHALHSKEKPEPADYLTVCEELDRRGTLEEVGGSPYIASLVNAVPTSGNIEYYGRIIEQAAVSRRLIFAAGEIAAIAQEADDGRAALAQAEQLIYQIGRRYTSSDFSSGVQMVQRYLDQLDELHKHRGEVLGVPTGYATLDHILGGFQKTDLIIAAGRPGMGKTSLALNFAYNAMIKYMKRVGIFSLEMSKGQLIQRFISMDTRIDSRYLRNGWLGDDDYDRVVAAADRFSNDLLWIDDTAALSLSAMRSKARRLMAEQPVDLFIVDYLQLMQVPTSSGKRPENRVQEISEISAGLKALAKELDVPVLAMAQLSRSVESRASKVPQLSDLREGGTIEQDADVVMFVYRDEYYAGYDDDGRTLSERPGTADIIIEKHRNGPTGETTLRFVESTTRFYNREENTDA